MRRAGKVLSSAPESVSVRGGESSRGRPAIVLEFEMKTQAQYKVVYGIFDTVQFYADGGLYHDLGVSFPKTPKRQLTPPPRQ